MEARSQQLEKRRGPLASLIDFAGWLLLVGLLVAAVAAAGWLYVRGQADNEIRLRVEQKLAEHYKDLKVSVGAAELVEGKGIEIRKISIRQPGNEVHAELVRIDEIFVSCDATLQNLVTGSLKPNHLAIRGLKLRLWRHADGSWDSASLHPLPKFGDSTPTATIKESTVEIITTNRENADPLVLRNVDFTVEPEAITTATEIGNIDDIVPASSKPIFHVRGSLGGDHFQRVDIEGSFNPSDGMWSMQGAVEGLAVSPRLLELLPREIISQQTLPRVRGLANLKFQLRRQAEEKFATLFTVSGSLTQGQIDDPRLPGPLTDVQAVVYCDNEQIRIDNLTANGSLGSLRLALKRDGYANNSPLVLRAKAEKLVLDHRLAKVLPPELKTTWNQFSPLGMINADIKLTFDGSKWKRELSMECLDVSFAYYKNPYRLVRGTGTILYSNDQVSVRMQALASGQTVQLNGDLRNPGPDVSGQMNITLNDPIPLDEKLLSSLDAKAQRVVRALRPRGMITFSSQMARRDEPDALPEKHIKITLHDCAINFVKFAYPIEKIHGTLEATNGQWEFHNLSGYNDSGNITCEGSWTTDAEDRGELKLDFIATEVPLEDELRNALSDDVRRLWTDLRPRGTLDNLHVGLRYSTNTRKTDIEVHALEQKNSQGIEGNGISIEPTWFPFRMDHVSGNFHYLDGRIDLRDISATHGRSSIQLAGFGETLENEGWQFRLTKLSADRLRADRDLVTALPEDLGKAVAKLNLSAPVNMYGTLGFSRHDKRASLETNWDLTFDVEDNSLDCGIQLEHLRGGVRLTGTHNAQGIQCRGELDIHSAMYKGVLLTKITGPLRLDKSNLYFGSWSRTPRSTGPPKQITAEAFGGKLAGDAQISLAGDSGFALHGTLIEADLAKLSKEMGMSSGSKISGKGYAVLDLNGVGGQPHTLRGKGTVRLRAANINEVPVILALFNAFIRSPDAGTFTASDMDFKVQGDDIYFNQINFSGDAISLKGRGHMDLDRQIDLDFYTVVGRDRVKIPFLSPLLGEGSRQLLQIRVGGTLDKPIITKEVLPALNDTLQQLFPELARTPKNKNR